MPPPGERARSLIARGATAAVLAASVPDRSEPVLHLVRQDGSTVLLVPQDHLLLTLAGRTPRGEISAIIELTDTAPVALRRPVRGLLWITGWLRVLSPRQARQVALGVAAHRCDDRLLDVGHGSRLLWLRPVFAVLSDAEGTAWLTPADLSAAEPDPFCHLEQDWLRHLDHAHPDVLHTLARHVFALPPGGRTHVRVRLAWTGSAYGYGSRTANKRTTCGWPSSGLPLPRSSSSPSYTGWSDAPPSSADSDRADRLR